MDDKTRTTLLMNVYRVRFTVDGREHLTTESVVDVHSQYQSAVTSLSIEDGWWHWREIFRRYCELQAKKWVRRLYSNHKIVILEVTRIDL